jgi:hypothetical protein
LLANVQVEVHLGWLRGRRPFVDNNRSLSRFVLSVTTIELDDAQFLLHSVFLLALPSTARLGGLSPAHIFLPTAPSKLFFHPLAK